MLVLALLSCSEFKPEDWSNVLGEAGSSSVGGDFSSEAEISSSSVFSSSSFTQSGQDLSSSNMPEESSSSANGSGSSSSAENASSSSSVTDNSSSSAVTSSSSSSARSSSSVPVSSSACAGPVDCYGKLKTNGKNIVSSKTNQLVQIRGVSLSGVLDFYNKTVVQAMAEDWKAEVIRVTTHTYNNNIVPPEPIVTQVIDEAISRGIYVIITWAPEKTGDINVDAAKTFFAPMVKKYGREDHVIFEILDGSLNNNWMNIKNYANEVISYIRAGSDNLILVGTSHSNQGVYEVINNKITAYENVAYVLQFTADVTPDMIAPPDWSRPFRVVIEQVLQNNIPIFVSEYITATIMGTKVHNATNTDKWLEYLDSKGISHIAGHIKDQRGSSTDNTAFFGNIASLTLDYLKNSDNMTESGKYVFNKLNEQANKAPW
jgi:endoglucanase